MRRLIDLDGPLLILGFSIIILIKKSKKVGDWLMYRIMRDSATRFVHEARFVQTDGQVFNYYLDPSLLLPKNKKSLLFHWATKRLFISFPGWFDGKWGFSKYHCCLHPSFRRGRVPTLWTSLASTWKLIVQTAWTCIGSFHVFLNCYTYQGLFFSSGRGHNMCPYLFSSLGKIRLRTVSTSLR